MKNISKITVKPDDNLEKTIEVLQTGNERIALVIDKQSKLLGTITDGDIRRSLIKHKSMSTPASEIMNHNPKTAGVNDQRDHILGLMKKADILHVPILDNNGCLVGLETLQHVIQQGKLDNPVFLMAGGYGKRLMPLTEGTPKPLLKVGSKPIIESIIDQFILSGFRNFYISTHYKSEMIKDYFNDGAKWNISIKYIEEKEPLGTAGSLSFLPDNFSDLPMIVMNADVITKLNFATLLKNHNHSNAEATMCVVEYDFEVPYGVIEIQDSQVQDIIEKPIHKFFINAGIYVLNQELIKSISQAGYLDMPDLLRQRINVGSNINMFPLYEHWADIGRFADLQKANNTS